MTDIDDIYLIEVVERGLPGDGFTTAEATAIRTDLDTMLARPVITRLDAVPDVVLSAIANGDILVYDTSTATWKNLQPDANGIQTLENGSAIGGATETRKIDFRAGLYAAGTGIANLVSVEAAFAGSGTADSVARSDHTHNPMLRQRTPFAATGLLSSGFRTLASQSITLLNGVTYLVEAETRGTVKGGGAGSSYYLERLTINGVVFTSPQMQAVGGVPRDLQHSHVQTITGTGVAITITAAIGYDTGDAIDVRAGDLIVRAWPNR